MPRNSSGVFSLVASYFASTGETITTSQHNPPLEDIATALTDSLPRSGVAGMLANLVMGGFRITGLGAPVAPTDAARLQDLELIGVPIGCWFPYGGTTAPTNWMLCDGRLISRTTYPILFARLGTFFGPGNGTTTFAIPDMRGRVAAGKDDMGGTPASRLTVGSAAGVPGNVLGGVGGIQSTSLTVAQMASHAHGGLTSVNGAHTHPYSIPAAGVSMNAGGTPIRANTVLDGSFNTIAAGDHQHTVFAEGGNAPHTNVQPTLISSYIIRVL